VRTLDPGAEIWMTWKSHGMPPQELVDELVPRSWNPEHGRVDAESVAAATELGLATTCWTVDDPQRAAELAALGAAGIISNRAAAVREHLAGAER
jgi:glycerophosphoryl diester phosphodiesterase